MRRRDDGAQRKRTRKAVAFVELQRDWNKIEDVGLNWEIAVEQWECLCTRGGQK